MRERTAEANRCATTAMRTVAKQNPPKAEPYGSKPPKAEAAQYAPRLLMTAGTVRSRISKSSASDQLRM